jgi:uncharacterized membrane-anchored protein
MNFIITCFICYALGYATTGLILPFIKSLLPEKKQLLFQKTVYDIKNTSPEMINKIINGELKLRLSTNPGYKYHGWRIVKRSHGTRTYELILKEK